jgi:hypothetical protein
MDEARTVIRNILSDGERLLWAGQPVQGVHVTTADALLIPFSVLWGGFAMFWEYEVVARHAPVFFMLWGLPFVGVGLYLIFGRFLVDAKLRANSYYGITNRRIVIVSGILNRTVKSVNLRTLSDVTMSERSNGSGTISFGANNVVSAWMASASWPGLNGGVPVFELPENVTQVYNIIRQAQSAAA